MSGPLDSVERVVLHSLFIHASSMITVSETRDLRLLVAVADDGGLSAAARRLHLTPSALSQQLRELERRLGGPLFLRRWRRLVATRAGQRYIEGARSVLAELARVEAETRHLLTGAAGVVRLAAACQQSYRWLPAILERYAETEPAIEVSLVADAAQEPFDWLLARRVDVALVAGRIPRDRRIKVKRLFRDELVAVVRRGHDWTRRPSVQVSALADIHLFTDAGALERTAPLGRALAAAQVTPRKTTFVPLVGTVALDLVRAGLGVTLMPHWTVAPVLRSHDLAAVRVGARGLWLEWSLATRNEELDRPVRALVDVIERNNPHAHRRAARRGPLASRRRRATGRPPSGSGGGVVGRR